MVLSWFNYIILFFILAPWDKSDNFFRSCLVNSDPTYEDHPVEVDSDGFEANEFYVILHKIFKYDSSEDLDSFVLNKVCLWNRAKYMSLKERCKLEGHHDGFTFLSSSSYIRYIQVYDHEMPVVKLCVSVSEDFSVKIMVHGKPVPLSHELWTKIPSKCFSVNDIILVLQMVSKYKVCAANSDPDLQDVIPDLPIGSFAGVPGKSDYVGYKDLYGDPSVRSRHCNLLVTTYDRCKFCSTYRKTLKKTQGRKSENAIDTPTNWLKANVPNTKLTETQKLDKMKQLKRYASSLEAEVEKLHKRLRRASHQDATLHTDESASISSVMYEVDQEV